MHDPVIELRLIGQPLQDVMKLSVSDSARNLGRPSAVPRNLRRSTGQRQCRAQAVCGNEQSTAPSDQFNDSIILLDVYACSKQSIVSG
jgi:hypothetical protein